MLNKNEPLVTLGIPAYNHQRYVGETIKSVINQNYKNLEVIIINDGSEDNTHEEILKHIDECKKRFVRFEYRNRENRGLPTTLNEMLYWAQGRYFTLIASDDIMLSHKVKELVYVLENSSEEYAIAFGDAYFINDEGKTIYLDEKGNVTDSKKGTKSFLKFYTGKKGLDYKNSEVFGSYASLIEGNYLPAMSFLAKTEKLREVGGWTPGNMLEDWEMWLKLSKNYKFRYIDKAVALYRWHGKNTVRLYRKRLTIDTIKLLLSEKDFAEKYGLYSAWEKNYYRNLLTLIKYGELSHFKEFQKNIDISKFFIFVFKRIIEKIL